MSHPLAPSRLRSQITVLSLLILAASCNFRPRSVEKEEPAPQPGVGNISRLDRAMNSLAAERAQIQKIAGGYDYTDGAFYSREGYLLFSDVKRNVIYKWTPDGVVAEFRKPGGYDGKDAGRGALVGARGITVDGRSQVVICEAGNRRIVRLSRLGDASAVVDRFEGKRLNGPRDLVFNSDGVLYFTDPGAEGASRELKVNGVYRVDAEGKTRLLVSDLSQPAGIALSHDQKQLYVTNADPGHPVLMRYELNRDGGIESSSAFFDFSKEKNAGQLGGVKLDMSGNVYVAGPGGVYVLSSDGKHLGTFQTPEQPMNLYWGKYADTTTAPAMGSAEYATTLYIAGGSDVYRIALMSVGVRP